MKMYMHLLIAHVHGFHIMFIYIIYMSYLDHVQLRFISDVLIMFVFSLSCC